MAISEITRQFVHSKKQEVVNRIKILQIDKAEYLDKVAKINAELAILTGQKDALVKDIPEPVVVEETVK